MEIEWDPDKDVDNIAKHGLSFGAYLGFDVNPYIAIDDRISYGEVRYRAFGRIGGRGYCLIFTMRDGNQRLISFRHAHDKEMRRYE